MKSTCIIGALLLIATAAGAQSGWDPVPSGVTAPLYSIQFTDALHGFAVGGSGTGLRTTDGGTTWVSMPMGATADLHGVAFSGATGVAVGNGGLILHSTDSGVHWGAVSSGVTDDLLSVTLYGNRGIIGGRSQTILYTVTGGAVWIVAQSGFMGGDFAGTAMVSPEIGFVGGSNSIFAPLAGKSTDGGAHWAFHTFYLAGNEGTINGIDFTDQNRGFAASDVWDGSGAVAWTTDGGTNWSAFLTPRPLYGIDFPVSDAGQTGFAVGGNGLVIKTANGGGTWQGQYTGVSVDLYTVSFVDPLVGFAAGGNGTILRTTTGGELPSSVAHLDREGAVLTAWPNPFRGSTVLRLSGPASGASGRVLLFDCRGRHVRTLRAEGESAVTWDGTDDQGRPLAAGSYLAKRAGEGSSAGRIGNSAAGTRIVLVR